MNTTANDWAMVIVSSPNLKEVDAQNCYKEHYAVHYNIESNAPLSVQHMGITLHLRFTC